MRVERVLRGSLKSTRILLAIGLLAGSRVLAGLPVVDTAQTGCYNATTSMACPSSGNAFYGQDAQYNGIQPGYVDNGDGTVSDYRTGLMWQKGLVEEISWDDAVAEGETFALAGYTDWRLPTVKELYSLIDFTGVFGTDSSHSVPFLDRDYFTFFYIGGSRFFDVQEWTSTEYVGLTMFGDETVFGVNFADGRIKGYPKVDPGTGSDLLKYARYVRGKPAFLDNAFVDQGDGTIRDVSSGLIWSKDDSGVGLDWEDALAWVQTQNAANYLGHNDWRLPNIKELQYIVNYRRAPDATVPGQVGPAISTRFNISILPDGQYPYFWSSTTEGDGPPAVRYSRSAYIAFGLAQGWMESPPGSGTWVLVNAHGAGAQRADPKSGDPADYPYGFGPQGDVVRIENYVRLVRGAASYAASTPTPGASMESGDQLAVLENPVVGSCSLRCELVERGWAQLAIFGVDGRLVRSLVTRSLDAGSHVTTWDTRDAYGRAAPAGVYWARLATARGSQTAKVVISR